MKTKILTAIAVCALLISLAGCAIIKTAPAPHQTEGGLADTDAALSAVTVQVPTDSIRTSPQPSEELQPAEEDKSVSTDSPQTEVIMETSAPKDAEVPEQVVTTAAPKEENQSPPTEPAGPVEPQPEPETPAELPKETEAPTPTESPAPVELPTSEDTPEPTVTEPPAEILPKTAYDYEFDIDAIRADCIAIGESMGYTLNTSLTPQNATWWNPVTASESNQGDYLRLRLEQYIRFHTVANLGAYGLDEITQFNIYCESRGGGAYAIYFVFA